MSAHRFHHLQDVAPLELFERAELRWIIAAEQDLRATVRPHGLGQIVDPDPLVEGQRDRPLDAVLQLANVPRPRIGEEPRCRFGCQAHHRLPHMLGMVVEEALREEQDVAPARSQRR